MAKIIYKFPILTTDEQEIHMPAGADILCVQVQNGAPCLWALCDTNPELEKTARIIIIFGTGHAFAASLKLTYIGTYQLANGALIWHTFEAIS